MAFNINRTDIVGNLTRDPEVRFIPNGQAVANFTVATNRSYNQNGEWKEAPTEFHDVVVWRKMAEAVGSALKKGDRVYATGRLQTRNWEAQDGSKRYKTELIADSVIGPDQVGKAMRDATGAGDGSGPGEENQVEAQDKMAADSSKILPKAVKKEEAPENTKDKSDSEEINIDEIPF